MIRKCMQHPIQYFCQSKFKFGLSEEHRKMFEICRPEMKQYLKAGVVTLVHASLLMLLPKIYTDLQYLMELKVSKLDQATVLTEYGWILGKWSLFFAFIGIFTYFRRYQYLDISNRNSIRMRTIAFRNIMDSDLYKVNSHHQSYVHHLITDIQTISSFTGETIFMGVRGLLILIGGTVCLLFQSPFICLIAAGTMTALNMFIKPRNLRLKALKQDENNALIRLSEHIAQRFNNIRLIKISHTEALEELKLNKNLESFYQYAKKVVEANGVNYASLESLGLFSLFLIAASGSLMISFEISNFSLLASSTYALYVALGFRSLISFNTELMKVMGIYSILEQKIGSIHLQPDYSKSFIECTNKCLEQIKIIEEESKSHHINKSKGLSIRIKNLSFTYQDNGSAKKIYENFNDQIPAGSVVGLVGPSGVGKSTLLNLITKLSEPSSGQIFLDELPVSLMNFSDIQQNISYVTQENFLFKGTVEQNLSYGNQGFDCSKENLERCLKMTNAYDFVQAKGGLSTVIEEKGSNFSGGEKQRIILARSLVKNPLLLLMDEATAGIDSESEKIIINSLKTYMKGTTIIFITHKIENFEPIMTKKITLGLKD